MNNFVKYLLINISVLFAFVLIVAISDPSGAVTSIGVALTLLSPIVFIIGIIAAIFEKTREYGWATLATSGIMFLSGCCVCSMSNFRL